MNCQKCHGNVPTGRHCGACGLKGPAGNGDKVLAFDAEIARINLIKDPDEARRALAALIRYWELT
jgi:hypothetical protein